MKQFVIIVICYIFPTFQTKIERMQSSSEQQDLWNVMQSHLLQFHRTFIEYLLLSTSNEDEALSNTTNQVQQLASRYIHALNRYRQCKLAFELSQISQMISFVRAKRLEVDPNSTLNRIEHSEKVWVYNQLEFKKKRKVYLSLAGTLE
jgi:hypothetical protein